MSEHQDNLRAMSYGVYVVTSKADNRVNGLTVAWASQVSLKPPLVAVAVDKRWYSHELLSGGEHFTVNVLADDQVLLGRHFGSSSGRTVDKLEGVEWEPGAKGVPRLAGCRAWIECRKIDTVSTGDHTLFIGEVVASELNWAKTGQVYDRGAYYG
ncbi:MAG: flavin reductase family protein [Candidatus Bathyarchaeia archaeon]